jgi:hypothetical protein
MPKWVRESRTLTTEVHGGYNSVRQSAAHLEAMLGKRKRSFSA